jgi:hypothetical protein
MGNKSSFILKQCGGIVPSSDPDTTTTSMVKRVYDDDDVGKTRELAKTPVQLGSRLFSGIIEILSGADKRRVNFVI